ncbi:MAG: hypothetical protein ABSE04_00075 [Candidatus Microgenomates bacterium]|jgi:hypothetical protein
MIRLKFFKICLLTVIPALILIVSASLKRYEGPYWLGSNSDPEYVYLLNSLNLSQFRQVQYVDHPGTTLEVLGAGVIKVFHKLRSKDTIINDVLHNPEIYLNAINQLIIFSLVGSLFLIGVLTLFLTEDIFFALIMQATPFLSFTLMDTLYHVAPEPLMLVATAWFSFIMLYIFYRGEKYSKFSIFLIAMISGFLIATKINSAPLVLVPLVILRWKEKIAYFFATLAALIFFTLPIYNRYSWFLDWTYSLFIHSGFYGTGDVNIVNFPLFLQSLRTILITEQFLIVITLVLAIVFIWTVIRKHKFTENRFLVALLLFFLADIIIVAKHFENHYLVPGLAMLGFSSVLILSLIKNNKIRTVASILVIVFAGSNFVQELKSTDGVSSYYAESIKLNEFVAKNYPDAIKVTYYRSSSIEYALNFGNELAFHRYDKQLTQMYQNSYFYEIWNGKFYDWGNVINLPSKGNIILQGTPFEGDNLKYKPNLVIQNIYNGDQETVYLINRTISP